MPRRRPKASAKKTKKKATARRSAPSAPSGARFDRTPYEVPVLELGEAVAMATALLAAKPSSRNPAIDEELRRLGRARDRAKAVGGSKDADARAYDAAMDRAWATFVRRIEDHASLPTDRHAHAAEAREVYAVVKDLSILQLNYLAEFAQIGARLDDLKREGLLHIARELAGPAFLDEVNHCLAEYGKALGVMDDAPSKTDRGEARVALVEAIGEYVYQVMALARAGRPDTWQVVETALRPIADFRAAQMRAMRTQPVPVPAPHPPV